MGYLDFVSRPRSIRTDEVDWEGFEANHFDFSPLLSEQAMSRQLYFYALPHDITFFRDSAEQVGFIPIRLDGHDSSFYTPRLFENPELLYIFDACAYQFTHPLLLNAKYFPQEPSGGGYSSAHSPCLEMYFSCVSNAKISKSRCYFSREGCPDLFSFQMIKPMVDKLYRVLKRQLSFHKERSAYFTPDAAKSLASGDIALGRF